MPGRLMRIAMTKTMPRCLRPVRARLLDRRIRLWGWRMVDWHADWICLERFPCVVSEPRLYSQRSNNARMLTMASVECDGSWDRYSVCAVADFTCHIMTP